FEVLLYDLTSTYFEGALEENPKAKYGHSRDKRTDCLQVVIALVITSDGFPLAYEVMDGNTSDRTTLHSFLDHIEKTYGKAKRMWVIAAFRPKRFCRRCGTRHARFSIWWEHRKARSNSMKRSGWLCPGRKSGSRWK